MIPAVYVSIEDQSLILPTVNTNRTVFGVILSNKGPHNRVVELTSLDQYHRLFGKPNIERTAQTNFFIDMALRQGAKCLVVRPSVVDSTNELANCSIANSVLYYNNLEGSEHALPGVYFFSNPNDVHFVVDPLASGLSSTSQVYNDIYGFDDIPLFDPGFTPSDSNDDVFNSTYSFESISKYVYCNKVGYDFVQIGDFISATPTDGVSQNIYKVQVVNKEIVKLGSTTYYRLVLKYPYLGATSKVGNELAITSKTTLDDTRKITFIQNSKYALVDSGSFTGSDEFKWIYPIGLNSKDARFIQNITVASSGAPVTETQSFKITCRSDDNGDLDGTGFIFSCVTNVYSYGTTTGYNTNYYLVRFVKDLSNITLTYNLSSDSRVNATETTLIPVPVLINDNMSAEDVIIAIDTAFSITSGVAGFTRQLSGSQMIITNSNYGPVSPDPSYPGFIIENLSNLLTNKYGLEKTEIISAGSNFGSSTIIQLNRKYEGPTVNNSSFYILDPSPAKITKINSVINDVTNTSYRCSKYFIGVKKLGIDNNTLLYTINQNSNIITTIDLAEYNSITIGSWIYPVSKPIGSFTPSEHYYKMFAKQVVDKKEVRNNVNAVVGYQIIINDVFGFTYEDSSISFANGDYELYEYTPITTNMIGNMRKEPLVNAGGAIPDPNIIFEFLGTGVGTYYNNIKIVGIRNTALEKMFTDNAGEATYKYAFMTLYIYEIRPGEPDQLIEGPWDVSLINRTINGTLIRNINSGEELFISSVINRYSNILRCYYGTGSDNLLTADNAENLRLMIQTIMSRGTSINKGRISTYNGTDGITLSGGEDGTLYDEFGRVTIEDPDVMASVLQSYEGTFTSVDGSIETLPQTIYGTFFFDYIVTGGWLGGNAEVFNSAVRMADIRYDALVIGDTGDNTRASDDLSSRKNSYSANTFNAMLYSQYRRVMDPYTGRMLWLSPVYHAIERHLAVDRQYWIAEPVANIEKGALNEPAELRYKPNIIQIEELMDDEVNVTISEPDGKYILTQLTTWKRLSAMKRAHVVKFVHYVKKELPSLLKDILQRKATAYWINQANARCNGFLSKFKDGSAISEKYVALKNYTVQVQFDDLRQELNIFATLDPIDVIETINVRILVV